MDGLRELPCPGDVAVGMANENTGIGRESGDGTVDPVELGVIDH